MDHSMTPEVARVYRQALTYALDETHVTYAAAVIFASWHVTRGQGLHGDDLDRSWDDRIAQPEAAQAFGEDD